MVTGNGNNFLSNCFRLRRSVSNWNISAIHYDMSMIVPKLQLANFRDSLHNRFPAWINNYMPRKVWDEIIYPFPNFNGCSLGMDEKFHPTFYDGCNDLSMLVLKLISVNKMGPMPVTLKSTQCWWNACQTWWHGCVQISGIQNFPWS